MKTQNLTTKSTCFCCCFLECCLCSRSPAPTFLEQALYVLLYYCSIGQNKSFVCLSALHSLFLWQQGVFYDVIMDYRMSCPSVFYVVHPGLYFQYILSDFNLTQSLLLPRRQYICYSAQISILQCRFKGHFLILIECWLASRVTIRRIALHNLSHHSWHRGHTNAGLLFIMRGVF